MPRGTPKSSKLFFCLRFMGPGYCTTTRQSVIELVHLPRSPSFILSACNYNSSRSPPSKTGASHIREALSLQRVLLFSSDGLQWQSGTFKRPSFFSAPVTWDMGVKP
eukprot:2586073-Amphidinium_carterae.1